MKKIPINVRFWPKVKKTEGCWEWIGAQHPGGYGIFRINNKNQYSHRVSWEVSFGPIPAGLCVLHRCDNRPCVRPDHLFLGTQKENTRDMISKGRNADQRGEKNPGAKLTAEQVKEIWGLIGEGFLQRAIGKKFGVAQQQISKIVRGDCWGHV